MLVEHRRRLGKRNLLSSEVSGSSYQHIERTDQGSGRSSACRHCPRNPHSAVVDRTDI